MMKRLMMAACITGACAGCYSFHGASSPALSQCRAAGDGRAVVEHVLVQNSGWFLFHRLPIVVGNVEDRWYLPWTFFRNDVSLSVVEGVLASYARSKGLDVVHEQVIDDDCTVFEVPFVNFPVALPWILTYRETEVSAVLVEAALRKSVAEKGAGE